MINYTLPTHQPDPSTQPVFSETAPLPQYEVYIPQEVHRKTENLLTRSREIAEGCLGTKEARSSQNINGRNQQNQRIERIVSYVPSFHIDNRQYGIINNQNTVIHNEPKKDENKNKEVDPVVRVIIFIVGALFAGASTYFLGKTIAQNEENVEKAESFEELSKHWTTNRTLYKNESFRASVDTINKKATAIMDRQKTDRKYKNAFLGSMIGTGALWAGAAVIGAANVMTLLAPGLVVCGVASVAMAGRYGYRSFSSLDRRDALVISQQLQSAATFKVE